MMHGRRMNRSRAAGALTQGQRVRQLANVLNASTPLGLALARAFTVGNVVIFRADADAALAGRVLLGHEERHSTQYAWCQGLPFLLFYFAAAAWSALRYGDPASGNPFERHAGLEAGGYVDRRQRIVKRRMLKRRRNR